MKKDSILITDGDKSYQTLKNIKLKSLKFGKPQNKVYYLNNINNYHSQLKKFIVRFNGVATKFLDYYVEYFNSLKQQIDIFASLFNTDVNYKVCNIGAKRVCFENPFVKSYFSLLQFSSLYNLLQPVLLALEVYHKHFLANLKLL